MIPDIRYSLGQCNVEVRQDFDGEERVFCVEPVLDLDIHLYERGKHGSSCRIFRRGERDRGAD